MIDIVPVRSSNIAGVGYDEETQMLKVVFKNKTAYFYFDVPKSVHEEFMLAGSKGKYFYSNIRNIFKYSKEENEQRNNT